MKVAGFWVEDLGLSCDGIRAFVGRDSGLGGFQAFVARVSGFRGEGFGLRWDFELLWEDSSFRGKRFGLSWGFRLSWGGFGVSRRFGFSSEFELPCGGIRAFESIFTNLRPGAAPLKRTDFANRIDFTRLRVRAAPLKKELAWAPSCAGEP